MSATLPEWIAVLDKKERQLVELSHQLLQRELHANTQYFDYGFIVFPMAKAYEGFIKRYLYDLGLIDTDTYEGRRFRVGRSLNPDISIKQRDEYWVFDDLEHLCTTEMARKLWEAWLECRNQIFHFFPSKDKQISLAQAQKAVQQIESAMEAAIECQRDATV